MRAWRIFVNIDGNDARSICPLPYSTLGNSRVTFDQVKKVDQLSCRDRIEQIRDQLDADELALIESLVPPLWRRFRRGHGLPRNAPRSSPPGF